MVIKKFLRLFKYFTWKIKNYRIKKALTHLYYYHLNFENHNLKKNILNDKNPISEFVDLKKLKKILTLKI